MVKRLEALALASFVRRALARDDAERFDRHRNVWLFASL
jgi:hypothetical protein